MRSLTLRHALVWLAVLFGLGGAREFVNELRAAEEPSSATAESAERGGEGIVEKPAKTLGEIIFGSDWLGLAFYGVLACFSVVATTVTIERLVSLRHSRALPPEFRKRLRELLVRREDSLDNLRTLCEAHPSPAASILRAGVLRAGRPLPEVEKSMEDAAAREMSSLRGRTRVLTIVGNVAPMVGLLGTVVGMILAFRVTAQVGTGKAERLAEGIYVALLTTAGGLMIAIPCMLLAAWFNAQTERFFRDIDECLMDTLPSFARMEDEVVTVETKEPIHKLASR